MPHMSGISHGDVTQLVSEDAECIIDLYYNLFEEDIYCSS